MDEEQILIDEVACDQRLSELAAADNGELTARLAPKGGDGVERITLEQRRVLRGPMSKPGSLAW
jgi:hypothetical protein